MVHGPMICQDCFTEADIETISGKSTTDPESQTSFECPNCGSNSFRI
jgi:predicted RNA-binding Zn-ribbon protein involved in translation (DUF1610 family)